MHDTDNENEISAVAITNSSWSKEDYQKRDFSAVTDATSLILKKIEFPLNRRRNLICALQGIAHGRHEFSASHLAIARRLGYPGKPESAEMSVYREMKTIKAFQCAFGRLLFDIEPGGASLGTVDGITSYKRTVYYDFITPAAVWLVNRARAMKRDSAQLKKDSLGQVMESIIGEAIDLLPPLAGSRLERSLAGKAAISASNPKHQARKHRRRETERERLLAQLSICLAEFDPAREAEEMRRFARDTAAHITDAAETIIAAQKERKTDLSDMVRSPASYITIHKDRREGEPRDGLHMCSPSASPIAESFCEEELAEAAKPAAKIVTGGVADTRSVRMLAAAIEYAKRGWRVFPLHAPDENGRCSCRRPICGSAGKHPRTASGVKDATTDEEQIRRWWSRWTGTNIGIATGADSGIICLDVDPRNGGDQTLEQVIAGYGALPRTFEVATGGGGIHLFFSYPAEKAAQAIKNSAAKLGPGLDIKSNGGYVVAAPSRHQSGLDYRVKTDCDLAALPGWLFELLTVPPPAGCQIIADGGADLHSLAGNIQNSYRQQYLEGERNEKMFQIACAMVGRCENQAAVKTEISRVNQLKCLPPLDEDEVERITASAARYAR